MCPTCKQEQLRKKINYMQMMEYEAKELKTSELRVSLKILPHVQYFVPKIFLNLINILHYHEISYLF